jgi:integrase
VLSNVRRDYQLVVLFTGLRSMDAATIRWEHVDFEARTLHARTPRAAGTALVQRQAAGAEIGRPAARIVDAAEQMSRLIAQLLELTRCNAPDTNSRPRP